VSIGGAAVAAPGIGASVVASNPSTIGCPAAPSGWNDPAVTKIIAAPESVPPPDPNPAERQALGGNQATVSCVYHGKNGDVTVAVSFALPADMNPVSDFDEGCGQGNVAWDDTNRVFSVGSDTHWAIASMSDMLGDLSAAEISSFEGVARKLLDNAQGYAHPCSLVTKPTAVLGRWYFDIAVAGTNLKDTFWTATNPNRNGIYAIKRISAATASLHLRTKAGTRLLAIRFENGVDFRGEAPKVAAEVRFRVRVTASQVQSCKKGATGTLAISTKPEVLLKVCGQAFHPVPARPVEFFNN